MDRLLVTNPQLSERKPGEGRDMEEARSPLRPCRTGSTETAVKQEGGTKLFSCSRGSSWAQRRLGRNDISHASGQGETDSSRRSVGLAPDQFKEETPFVTLAAGLWADLETGHIEVPNSAGNIFVRS